MPDIYQYFGYIFSFYTREHEPIHVHVRHGDRQSIFDLIIKNKELIEVKKRGHGNPLTSKEEKIARAFIGEHWEGIVDKWISLFVMNARVRCTNIKTKIQTDEK